MAESADGRNWMGPKLENQIVDMVEQQALERSHFRKREEDVQLMFTSPKLQRNTPAPTTLRGGRRVAMAHHRPSTLTQAHYCRYSWFVECATTRNRGR